MSRRMEKVNMEIRKQLSDIIYSEIDNPHIGMLSITRVMTSSDLRESRVYISLLEDKNREEVVDTLNKMAHFLRKKLSMRLRLKTLPQLIFFYDDLIRYSVDIYNKIEDINDR